MSTLKKNLHVLREKQTSSSKGGWKCLKIFGPSIGFQVVFGQCLLGETGLKNGTWEFQTPKTPSNATFTPRNNQPFLMFLFSIMIPYQSLNEAFFLWGGSIRRSPLDSLEILSGRCDFSRLRSSPQSVFGVFVMYVGQF